MTSKKLSRQQQLVIDKMQQGWELYQSMQWRTNCKCFLHWYRDDNADNISINPRTVRSLVKLNMLVGNSNVGSTIYSYSLQEKI